MTLFETLLSDLEAFGETNDALHAVRTPDDLKGMKMRVVGSPLFLATFNALGANPTQMSWADAQPAMATGAVDGQENPLAVFSAAKLHTVDQKFIRITSYNVCYTKLLRNITKCCTDTCPEHINITDNGIIPLKERVVDRFYDPFKRILNALRPSDR